MAFESDPFNDLLRLQEQLAALLGAPQGESRALGGRSSGVYPPVNIFRKQDATIVRAELPGVRPEDISITVEGHQLTLAGERRPPETPNMAFHRRERPWGKFSRSIVLPEELDTERVEAQFRNGVLTLTLPVAAAAKPRQIAVKAA
jgi:HSP20 family protein